MRGDCICRLLCARVRPPEQNALLTVADPGEVPSPQLYFQTELRPEGPKKFSIETGHSLSQGLDLALDYMAKIAHWDSWEACNNEVSVFPGRGGGLAIMAYMGRLCPKGVPFPGLRYMKG